MNPTKWREINLMTSKNESGERAGGWGGRYKINNQYERGFRIVKFMLYQLVNDDKKKNILNFNNNNNIFAFLYKIRRKYFFSLPLSHSSTLPAFLFFPFSPFLSNKCEKCDLGSRHSKNVKLYFFKKKMAAEIIL